MALRRVIAKLWTSETDCSPIDFRRKNTFFLISEHFSIIFLKILLRHLYFTKSPSAYGIPIRTVLILRDRHAAGSVHTALFTTTSLLMSRFLFFLQLTFMMASAYAPCQRHENSITPHETNKVRAGWGLRKNIFGFFIRLYKMFIGEQQKTMVRNTL